MRKNKFRCWDVMTEEMFTLVEAQIKGMNVLYILEGTDLIKVMQYTGLKDTHGNEIFEGDILSYTKQEYIAGYERESNHFEVVEFMNGVFACNNDLLIDVVMNDDENEVVGNIYENPGILGYKYIDKNSEGDNKL